MILKYLFRATKKRSESKKQHKNQERYQKNDEQLLRRDMVLQYDYIRALPK